VYATLDLDAQTSSEAGGLTQVGENWASFEAAPSWATHVYCKMNCLASAISASNYAWCIEGGHGNKVEGVHQYAGGVINYVISAFGWCKMDASKCVRVGVTRGAGTVTLQFSILGWGKFDT
jgi:hypothetical protein